ncbi:MAG: aminopeptidase, partial [Actinomycetes bacterium]|nr:aminopeptidase [Actinomycetes bacterium]
MASEISSAQAEQCPLTPETLQTRLKAYAQLLIARGVVLREGQTLIVQAPVEAYEFTRLVVEAAFAAGAKDVSVRWGDTPCGETRLRHAALETLKEVSAWLADSFNTYTREDVAWLALETEFPPPVGLDLEKVGAARVASMRATKPFMDARMSGIVHWNIAAVASVPWASLVYPDLAPDEALTALWRDVLLCSRCLEGDPVVAWDKHIAVNDAFRDKLNAAEFSELHFTSASTGTDLRVGL